MRKYLLLLLVLCSCDAIHVEPDTITIIQVGTQTDNRGNKYFLIRGAYLNGDVVYIDDPDAFNSGKYSPGQRIPAYRQQ